MGDEPRKDERTFELLVPQCDHVWVTYPNARVSVCKNCGNDRPVAELAKDDPLRKTTNT